MSGKRFSAGEISRVVIELDRWGEGELGPRLTWEKLESSSGFSRQALQAHPRIKAAYIDAKKALRGGLVKTRAQHADELSKLRSQNSMLLEQLESLKKMELEWLKRWQRIAYHVRAKGVSFKEVDRDIPDGVKAPGKKEANRILGMLDKPLMPHGRT